MNAYQVAGKKLLRRHDVTVRKWRTGTTGVAYEGGTIETPEPRGPVSFGTLAHEVGHVVLHWRSGRGRTPRWVEEVEAWEFALNAVEEYGLNGYERVEADAIRSLVYAFAKAIRRGVLAATIRDRFPTWWKLAVREDRNGVLGYALLRAAA